MRIQKKTNIIKDILNNKYLKSHIFNYVHHINRLQANKNQTLKLLKYTDLSLDWAIENGSSQLMIELLKKDLSSKFSVDNLRCIVKHRFRTWVEIIYSAEDDIHQCIEKISSLLRLAQSLIPIKLNEEIPTITLKPNGFPMLIKMLRLVRAIKSPLFKLDEQIALSLLRYHFSIVRTDTIMQRYCCTMDFTVVLEFAKSKGIKIDKRYVAIAMINASRYGQLDYIKFLVNSEKSPAFNQVDGKLLMDKAATLEVLEYLYDNRTEGCSQECLYNMCEIGNLKAIKFLLANNITTGDSKALFKAATNGHLDIVQYFVETLDLSCSPNTIDATILSGNLDVVRYLCSKFPQSYQEKVIYSLDRDHVAMLRYLYTIRNVCWNKKILENAIVKNLEECAHFIVEQYPEHLDVTLLFNSNIYSSRTDTWKQLFEIYLNKYRSSAVPALWNEAIWLDAVRSEWLSVLKLLDNYRISGIDQECINCSMSLERSKASREEKMEIIHYLYGKHRHLFSYQTLLSAIYSGFHEATSFLLFNEQHHIEDLNVEAVVEACEKSMYDVLQQFYLAGRINNENILQLLPYVASGGMTDIIQTFIDTIKLNIDDNLLVAVLKSASCNQFEIMTILCDHILPNRIPQAVSLTVQHLHHNPTLEMKIIELLLTKHNLPHHLQYLKSIQDLLVDSYDYSEKESSILSVTVLWVMGTRTIDQDALTFSLVNAGLLSPLTYYVDHHVVMLPKLILESALKSKQYHIANYLVDHPKLFKKENIKK